MDFTKILLCLLCLSLHVYGSGAQIPTTSAEEVNLENFVTMDAMAGQAFIGTEISPKLHNAIIYLEGMETPAQEMLRKLLSNAESGNWGNVDILTLSLLNEDRGSLSFADTDIIVSCSLRLHQGSTPVVATIEECEYDEVFIPQSLREMFITLPSR